MSKITFRADDDLVDAVEELDASKSEVMRDALRAYLDNGPASDDAGDTFDDLVSERIDALLEQRLGMGQQPARDVNVNITVEPGEGVRADAGPSGVRGREPTGNRSGRDSGGRDSGGRDPGSPGGDPGGERGRRRGQGEKTCAQCGESVSDDHVYCPNCGEKAARRVFCECGDEVRADWAFCPHCGRRTASADALDR